MAEGFVQWRVEREGVLDSTNRAAGERVLPMWQRGESAEGVVIVAERQTAGKGQHGRVWESPGGGLYLSAIVEKVAPAARDRLALLAGVAVAEGLREEGVSVGLQWPNDLMIEGKKIGGILCESIVWGEKWAGIVGIGVNVNTQVEELPAEVRGRATSLLAHDGRRRDVREIELLVLGALGDTLKRVADEGIAPVIKRVRQLDALRGKRVELQDGERVVSGVAEGIGDFGELLIGTDNGIVGGIMGGVVGCAMGTLTSVEGKRLR